MRQITQKIVWAFERRQTLRIDNSRTDGQSLWLFGNKIAEWRGDGLWITNAGWDSRTTYERLNGLTGVHVRKQRGSLLLNNLYWDGRWTHVDTWNNMGGIAYEPETQTEQEDEGFEFDLTSEWVEEGYSRPVYSVFHSVDVSSLEEFEQMLEQEGIPSRRMESDTAGVYRPNHFIVVRPEDFEDAKELLVQ